MKQLSRKYIGSLSHATMRSEDLIPTFMSFLEEIAQQCGIVSKVKALREEVDGLHTVRLKGYGTYYREDDKGKDGLSSADRATILVDEDMWDLLNDIAPSGTYFGASEGDGSDYGFWAFCPICGMHTDEPGVPCCWHEEEDNG